jgi:hypothetical protein
MPTASHTITLAAGPSGTALTVWATVITVERTE